MVWYGKCRFMQCSRHAFSTTFFQPILQAATVKWEPEAASLQPLANIVEIFSSVKGKVFQYSLPSVGPGADPGVQAVSPQVT